MREQVGAIFCSANGLNNLDSLTGSLKLILSPNIREY